MSKGVRFMSLGAGGGRTAEYVYEYVHAGDSAERMVAPDYSLRSRVSNT